MLLKLKSNASMTSFLIRVTLRSWMWLVVEACVTEHFSMYGVN